MASAASGRVDVTDPTQDAWPATLWPLSGLSARAGNLELRYADDDLLVDLAAVAARGVHEPSAMPFSAPWTRGTPLQVARSVLQYQWGNRASLSPARWAIELAVLVDGRPVGFQGMIAADFAVLGSIETGSWIGLEYQGHGIGTRMRALVLEVIFSGLGAREATTGAWADNASSNAVTRRLGYTRVDSDERVREGAACLHHAYRMSRESWLGVRDAHRRHLGAEPVLDGIAPVRQFLGLDDPQM